MRSSDRPSDAGVAPSVGSRGDAHDNALLASVHWFNTARLLEPISYVPPDEHEARH